MNSINPIADLPMGLGMALARDMGAMEHFASLSPDQQRDIIDQTHRIRSKTEMQALVSRLGNQYVDPQDLVP